MAFALLIVQLEEAMKKPGCPVCRMQYDAAVHSIDAFLWENVNDPVIRKPINDAYGFCLQHTQMLVAKEMMTSGPVLGVNIIYALLAKKVARELKQIQPVTRRRNAALDSLKRLAGRFTSKRFLNSAGKHSLLIPAGRCPVCLVVEESGENVLETLFEILNAGEEHFTRSYTASSGLCLAHLRSGLEQNMEKFPAAANLLIQDTLGRLTAQESQMQEYLRKHDWEYRAEGLTPEEQSAWLHTLTFFTGLPEARFTHKIKEF
jgi:hypothetical protein